MRSRTQYHQPDYLLMLLLLGLLLFGLVMLSSAGSVLGFQRFHDSNFFLKKQIINILIGFGFFLVTYQIDYRRWRAWSVPMMIAVVGLLLVVFLPGIGSYFLGAHRWVNLGFFLLQPSELAKIALIVYLAAWLEKREGHLNSWRGALLPFLLSVGVVAGLIIAEPDLGTTTILIVMAMVLYFLAGGPWRYMLGLLSAGVATVFLLIKIAPYRAQRFTVFLNPALDPLGIGYHLNQALLAIGSGGWFGLGLGHSRQKFNYLPEPAGDSIFAIMAEELGFIAVVLFLLAWGLVIYRGIQIARHAPDRFAQLAAAGITVWLGFQTLLNIAALSKVVPLTGVPLPLLSYGGSSIITSMAAIGILLNISRQTVWNRQR